MSVHSWTTCSAPRVRRWSGPNLGGGVGRDVAHDRQRFVAAVGHPVRQGQVRPFLQDIRMIGTGDPAPVLDRLFLEGDALIEPARQQIRVCQFDAGAKGVTVIGAEPGGGLSAARVSRSSAGFPARCLQRARPGGGRPPHDQVHADRQAEAPEPSGAEAGRHQQQDLGGHHHQQAQSTTGCARRPHGRQSHRSGAPAVEEVQLRVGHQQNNGDQHDHADHLPTARYRDPPPQPVTRVDQSGGSRVTRTPGCRPPADIGEPCRQVWAHFRRSSTGGALCQRSLRPRVTTNLQFVPHQQAQTGYLRVGMTWRYAAMVLQASSCCGSLSR